MALALVLLLVLRDCVSVVEEAVLQASRSAVAGVLSTLAAR